MKISKDNIKLETLKILWKSHPPIIYYYFLLKPVAMFEYFLPFLPRMGHVR